MPRSPATTLPLTAETTTEECREIFLEHLDFVERTVGTIARRHALSVWEAEDFGGQVKLKLLSDDYAILRKFQGKSRLTTYLTTVIQNLFRDFRIQQWGKWRPSAAAKRLGNLGVQLEALLYRDQFSFSEAGEILRNRLDVEVTEHELLDVATQLRPRTSRRFENDLVLSRLEGPESGDRLVVDGERERSLDRLSRALRLALLALETQDRIILRLRFVEGLTIRAVAATLDLDQRRIYTRVRRILRVVRERIVEEGVEPEEVLDLLDWPACAVEVELSQTEAPLLKVAT